jgi:hypothetical protein
MVGACLVVGCAQAELPSDHLDGGDGGQSDGGGPGGSGGAGGSGARCDPACVNPHGTTRCVAGNGCVPSCEPGWAACGAVAEGCTTAVDGSIDACGGCGRACANANATTRQCTAGLCTPACTFPYADCSRPEAPMPDDGCESNGKIDSDEGDDLCNGRQSTLAEGDTLNVPGGRILPSGDTDVIHVRLNEANHVCFPGTGQSYQMRIQLVPPVGADLRLRYNFGGCDNSWRSDLANPICYSWSGTCAGSDNRDLYFQIYGDSQANSCLPYALVIEFATEGQKVAGCP